MHREILSQNQIALLPLISAFKREYYLVGGTAIALYIGHRRSIDFDLFKHSAINHKRNLDKMARFKFPLAVTRRVAEQMNLTVNGVKLTFFEYPFEIPTGASFENYVKLPSLLDLAAMKSYALGRRAKWKDYVDLYFLIKHHFSVAEISHRAQEIYGELFSVKLFRAQLAFHKDIDYSEEVEYVIPNPPTPDEVRGGLIEKAADIF
jgi:hypothetical protein